MELNPFQSRAVTTPGHCTILACPGSGKTRVLSTRAGHLITNNELGRLCAVTFTRDASNELMGRILESCGKEHARRLAIGTFHSMAMAQIKRNSKTKPPRLLNDFERTSILRRCWQEHAKKHEFDEILKAVDLAKSKVAPAAFSDIAIQKTFVEYEKLLRMENAMDFSDLLLVAVRGMASGDIAPLPLAWLLVDEAQDMDEVQMEWVLLHGRAGIQVTLVGDDDQSLYAFRHALGYVGLQEVSFSLNSVELTLPVNYRCAPNILHHAATLIAHNPNRAAKNIVAHKEVPGEIVVHRVPSRSEESEVLLKTLSEQLPLQQWAVLGRTNALLDTVEVALHMGGIPYTRSGGKSVWDQAIGGVFSGLLRSLHNNSWVGIANALGFCGANATWLNEHSRESHGLCLERLDQALSQNQEERMRKLLSSMRDGFANWSDQIALGRTSLVVHGVAGYLSNHCKKSPQAKLLKLLAESFCRMNGTLGQRLALLSRDRKEEKHEPLDIVHIMTLHSSKGLEFENVWMMGCEEGNLPHADSTEEDERRLMYVGMTRAKSRLVISSALQEGLESRFLEESKL